MASIDALELSFFTALRPPPRLTVSQWADENAYLSPESSAEPGRWKNIPYQVGIQDAFTDPELEEVWVMKSARVGWTKMLGNLVGYHIERDPCSMMMVQPTEDDAEGYSKEELAPMIRDTPSLSARVSDAKTRSGGNTILDKVFPGGKIGIVGANSPTGFRRVSRRVVMFDEIDAYPASAGTEGDPIKLGIKRTDFYWNRKIVGGTTPLVKGYSRIEKLFETGDQRRFFVPCPQCGHRDKLVFRKKEKDHSPTDGHFMEWPSGEPELAHFVCSMSGCVIEHKDKHWMVENGEWRSTATGRARVASFHIWAAYSYSPNADWGRLAREYYDIVATKDKEQLQVFINTVLGELWEEDFVKKISANELSNRAEFYEQNVVPEAAVIVTAGVDVQDNRFAVTLYGWGEGEEAWCLNWFEMYGDPASPEIWKQLSNVLLTPLRHESGRTIPISAAAIDSGGHFTQEVYQYVRENKKHIRTTAIIAVKGASQKGKPAISKPTAVDVNFKGQKILGGADLHMMGSDTVKGTLYARFKLTEPGPRFFHFNTDLPLEFYEQLMAEKQVTRYVKNRPVLEWELPPGKRNEALDCTVMAYAALQWLYMRFVPKTIFEQFRKRLGVVIENKPEPETNRPAQAITSKIPNRTRGGFVSRY